MKSLVRWVLVSALLLVAGRAAAQEEQTDDQPHRLSITISPIHLLFPIVELTGEYRLLGRKLGAAGIAGGGVVDGVGIFEVGAQGRYYVLGSFRHGAMVGAEALFITGGDNVGSTTVTAGGLAVGPFVGYKFAARFGFTFDTQLGVQFFAIRASAGSGQSSSSDDVIVLLNLNVGWSF